MLMRAVRAELAATTIVIVTSEASGPVASQFDREGKHNLLLDPGDRGCFNRMWLGLLEIYPELQRR